MNSSGNTSRGTRPIAIWLLIGVAMIIVQIILGGITRLTDSGLSITEWQPLLGAVPPTSDAEWNKAFESYKQIAQYKYLNQHFSLEDFKDIFFWEWLHRFWGRLIGVVFAIPFVVFLIQKRFTRDMVAPMIILFLLGGLQGAVGWIMVQSGLNDEDLYVSHIRLAIHFMSALVLLVYTYWFALRLLVKTEQFVSLPSSRNWTVALLALLTLQLIYGAFMAGLKAAQAAPTWPDINGAYFPAGIGSHPGVEGSFFSALVNNPVTIHFIHRNLAYLITVLIIIWTIRMAKRKLPATLSVVKWWPLLFVIIQVALGVGAVLTSVKKQMQHWGLFEWFAQLHQFVSLLLLLSLITILFLQSQKRSAAVLANNLS